MWCWLLLLFFFVCACKNINITDYGETVMLYSLHRIIIVKPNIRTRPSARSHTQYSKIKSMPPHGERKMQFLLFFSGFFFLLLARFLFSFLVYTELVRLCVCFVFFFISRQNAKHSGCRSDHRQFTTNNNQINQNIDSKKS